MYKRQVKEGAGVFYGCFFVVEVRVVPGEVVDVPGVVAVFEAARDHVFWVDHFEEVSSGVDDDEGCAVVGAMHGALVAGEGFGEVAGGGWFFGEDPECH